MKSLSRKSRLTTIGSTKAVQPSPPSNSASTNDSAADPKSINTSWSLNCSNISSQIGVGGSSGRAGSVLAWMRQRERMKIPFGPYFDLEVTSWVLDRPWASVTWKYLSISPVDLRKASSIVFYRIVG